MPQPVSRYHFTADWGGSRTGFAEISGLNIEIEPVLFREGASPEDQMRKLPGLRSYSNIILKRSILKGDNDFFEWINTKQMNQIQRRDITISLLNENHEPIVVWRVKSAFPVKYTGPVLSAGANSVAMECLELTHEGLTVVKT
ncbi:phage tail protein [Niabella sp. CC-SYL272]|uniref:phage tail protein n=1 Tax=Niabella agricola TaxID=2891571 RepID=UPI001F1DF557|nr:phage tail protein [Niabella agricola]MCF3110532.1 phage tail protein [Niabella agricola]